ncbi:multidrug ABC transporter [Bordetella sp. N]|nr:multidrug ABC transporter [Bordetella sp. N]
MGNLIITSSVLPPAARRRVFAGLLLAMLLGALDQSIVSTALPVITTELGGLNHLAWVVTSFMLTSTVSAPLYGKLSDMYGRKPLFAVSIVLFLGASVLCGTADSMLGLILARALQGLGAGGLMTLAQTIIAGIVPNRDRARYQGLFTATFAVSSVAGPILGGVITTHLSWRWIFLINPPLGIAALLLVLSSLPGGLQRGHHAIDYMGAALVTLGTSALLLLFNSAGIPLASSDFARAVLIVVAVGAFAMLYFTERRAREPLIDLKLFRNASYSICVAASGLMSFAMMGSLIFMPLYYQLVLQQTPTQSGAMVLPQVVTMVISSVAGGRFGTTPARIHAMLPVGVGLECLGLVLLAVFAHFDLGVPAFLFAVGVLGCGMGMGMSIATVIVQNSVSESVRGAATATMSFVRSLGGSLGTAVSGAVMAYVLSRQFATVGAGIDAGTFLERGLSAVSALAPEQQLTVVDMYRQSIGASLVAGGIFMFGGFLLALKLFLMHKAGAKDAAQT